MGYVMKVVKISSLSKVMTLGLISFACLSPSGASMAQVASVKTPTSVTTDANVNYVSSYIFRGRTVNKGSAVQPNLELIVAKQAQLGVWGNFPVDQTDQELKQEVEVYFRYGLPIGFANLIVGAWEYVYPEDRENRANDREIEFTAAMDLPLNPSLSAFVGIEGERDNSEYYEFSLNEDVLRMQKLSLSVGGNVGYLDSDEGEDGFTHAMITLGAGYEILNASLNWIIETDDEVNELDGQEDFYLQVGSGYSF